MRKGPVWLIGMMGAGKSTVGALLAARTGRPFVDTDDRIEREAGASVAEIFEREGEASFRRRERAVVQSLRGEEAVVALGGGALTTPEVREIVATSGVLVYLRASPDTLLERVGEDAVRPLLAGLDPAARRARLASLVEERRGGYECAAVVVDTDGCEAGAVAEILEKALARRGEAS